MDMVAFFRIASRAHFARVWRAYKAGNRLKGEDKRFAERMAAHPEWTEWWEQADEPEDVEVLTPEGTDPFAALAVEVAVEGMIGRNEDKVARKTYRKLRSDGLTHEEARAEIGQVFVGVLWEVGKGRVAPENQLERFDEALRLRAAGQGPEKIFPGWD
ncbi:MAG: DUF1841 family protein [Nitrospinota bacterium]